MCGHRTLLLCYNQPLQDWFQATVPASFANDVVVLSYHSLASRLCRKAVPEYAGPVPLGRHSERTCEVAAAVAPSSRQSPGTGVLETRARQQTVRARKPESQCRIQ